MRYHLVSLLATCSHCATLDLPKAWRTSSMASEWVLAVHCTFYLYHFHPVLIILPRGGLISDRWVVRTAYTATRSNNTITQMQTRLALGFPPSNAHLYLVLFAHIC